ncbi:MAG TPA: hypothetical protein VMV59_02550 [Candidatus Dormibacteraeota bacterium]|nr:hypothetical protein [Candidatus Dormibacteraeota bacterium]
MTKLRGTIVAMFAAGALACAALAMAQAQKPAPPASEPYRPLKRDAAIIQPNDARATAVNVVREINTAEVEHSAWHGTYASWNELYSATDEQKRWQRLQLSAGPEIVPGWTLSLVASADGKSFELSLRSLADKCGFSFFSDQRGVIYEGSAIGCAKVEVVPAHR